MLRRFISFVLIACCSSVLFVSVFYHLSWRQIQPAAFRGEGQRPTEDVSPGDEDTVLDMRPGGSANLPKHMFNEPKIDSTSPYPLGATKPAGSNYTRTLILPRLKSEDTSWMQQELGDMIEAGLLTPAVYTVNDRKAKLHPPKNKGHEVMVYLSYIIDFYDQLPDVSIFMHAHRYAWHNNELLDTDAAQMVRHLSPERVTREGYMNLRCHWDPGCPTWLHPGSTKDNYDKPEEVLLAECWSELFPMDPVPSVLAQACCAQFAVSRERILATPKMRYIVMRDWLIRTELTDYLSGRIFEHIWQYIFTAAPVHCPSMSACYCDGYGLCFGGPEEFDHHFELKYRKTKLDEELHAWELKAKAIEQAKTMDGSLREEAQVAVPELGKDKELDGKIKVLKAEMERLRIEALNRGKSPKQRAVESGREWNEGDGF
ncbi:hypothetical protein Slin15195_G016690 [Septoria linicola]|uniref:Uncharacterized protein n=1 Tax=Septoria linicola TaxID=215465 RepID=A0A9Q9AFX1_9PEZI|nr:hypothetical protein Slin14017_G016760 [Septoria linicola]USW48350.1 hypothetical protein Slin15195_G016690 [Septoria linicola]